MYYYCFFGLFYFQQTLGLPDYCLIFISYCRAVTVLLYPTQNLEITYYFEKDSELVLQQTKARNSKLIISK